MRRRPWQTTLSIALLLAASIVLAGCPKKPTPGIGGGSAGTAAGATGAAGGGTGSGSAPGVTGTGPGAIGQGGTTTGGTTLPAGPSPAEFSETAKLADVHFDFDQADIRPADKEILSANVKWLKANAKALILIEGHCDERGTNEYNLALGQRRATAARDFLVAGGIEAKRINLISYGEERPLCTGRTEGCWSQNRRAHFLVKP